MGDDILETAGFGPEPEDDDSDQKFVDTLREPDSGHEPSGLSPCDFPVVPPAEALLNPAERRVVDSFRDGGFVISVEEVIPR